MRPITPEEAYEAVETFAVMAYFGSLNGLSKAIVAEELIALVNTPNGAPLRNTAGRVVTVPPVERLNRFAKAFRRLPGGWPGIGEMGALYQQMFPPGDGIKRPTPTIEGFTGEDNAAGSYTPLADPAPAPLQIEAPLPEADRRELDVKFSILKQRLIVGKED